MRFAARFLGSLAVASLVSCGGENSVPVQTVFLTITLAASGELRAAAPPAISQVVVVTSAEQLAALSTGRFDVPPALAAYDFAAGDLVYVEGLGDSDPTSVARIGQISRSENAEYIQAEICSSGPRVPGNHRPFALYSTPNIVSLNSFAITLGTYDCPSVRRIATTFVSDGVLSGSSPPPTVIRTQADFDVARAAGVIPASYPMPDFTQTNLLYLDAPSGPHTAYLRLMVLAQEVDGSRTAVAELCHQLSTIHGVNLNYAVYSMPAFSGIAREVIVARDPFEPGTCVTTP